MSHDKRKSSSVRRSGPKSYAVHRSVQSDAAYSLLHNELEELSRYQANWNSYGSEAPNPTAIDRAEKQLQAFDELGFLPQRVAASAEGGVALVFKSADKRAMIECLNDGTCGGVLYDLVDEGKVFPVDNDRDLPGIVEKIRAYFGATDT